MKNWSGTKVYPTMYGMIDAAVNNQRNKCHSWHFIFTSAYLAKELDWSGVYVRPGDKFLNDKLYETKILKHDEINATLAMYKGRKKQKCDFSEHSSPNLWYWQQ